MIIECPSCQVRYSIDEARIPTQGAKAVCKKCGQPIIIPPLAVEACPKCDHPRRPGDIECPSCGVIYDKITKPQEPPSDPLPESPAPILPTNKRRSHSFKVALALLFLVVAGLGSFLGYRQYQDSKSKKRHYQVYIALKKVDAQLTGGVDYITFRNSLNEARFELNFILVETEDTRALKDILECYDFIRVLWSFKLYHNTYDILEEFNSVKPILIKVNGMVHNVNLPIKELEKVETEFRVLYDELSTIKAKLGDYAQYQVALETRKTKIDLIKIQYATAVLLTIDAAQQALYERAGKKLSAYAKRISK